MRRPCRPAAFALVLLGEPSVQPLIQCITREDNDWLVKLAAAWALGLIGDKRAVPHLRGLVRFRVFENLLSDPLSRTAREAIQRIKMGRAVASLASAGQG